MATLGLVLACVAALGAGDKPAQSAPEGLVNTLQQAHALLARADGDYQGHRMKALHHIKAACHELGVNAHCERHHGKNNEAQTTSDEQLRSAQALLQTSLQTATTANSEHVAHHIRRAIEELNTALKIK